MDAWGDGDIATLLGLDRQSDFTDAETEVPDLLCLIETGNNGCEEPDIDAMVDAARIGVWTGKANKLSQKHTSDWPTIDEACEAARKLRTTNLTHLSTLNPPCPPFAKGGEHFLNSPDPTVLPPLAPILCELTAPELIKQRRSAQAFDGVTAIPAKTLYRILDSTLPRNKEPPFDLWNWPPRVHLVLFIHRVVGLPPGVYVFCRSVEAESMLRAAMKKEFLWETCEACPSHLKLFRLLRTAGGNNIVLPTSHRRGQCLQPRDAGRVRVWFGRRPVGLPSAVLGMRNDWSSALSGSRSGWGQGNRHRLFLRRPCA